MPSGAVTLLDIAKTSTDDFTRGVIGTYATSYQPMAILPLIPAVGGRHGWDVEYQLPHTTGGARNFNAAFTASRSAIAPFSDNIRIYGGQVQIDPALALVSPSKVPMERTAQIKAMAYRFTQDIFEGASGTYLRGIKSWLDNEVIFAGQTVDCGSASAGAALITDKLDMLLSKHNIIPGSTFIYTLQNIALRARKLQRGTPVSGDVNYNMQYASGEWGTASTSYNGVPIIALVDGKGNNLLSATEGDGASGTMYCVTYGEEMFTGFQQTAPQIRDIKDNTYDYFNLMWLVGTAPQAIKCISRLRYITNAQ